MISGGGEEIIRQSLGASTSYHDHHGLHYRTAFQSATGLAAQMMQQQQGQEMRLGTLRSRDMTLNGAMISLLGQWESKLSPLPRAQVLQSACPRIGLHPSITSSCCSLLSATSTSPSPDTTRADRRRLLEWQRALFYFKSDVHGDELARVSGSRMGKNRKAHHGLDRSCGQSRGPQHFTSWHRGPGRSERRRLRRGGVDSTAVGGIA